MATTEPVAVASRAGISAKVAFWLVAVLYAMFLFASSAPSPLYLVYQQRWHFSATTLTVIFAAYVFALLAALLFTGSLSDHIGRRPTVLGAGVAQVTSMVTFAVASGVGWLVLARVLQGLATGIATGAMSAWLLDLQPADRPTLGATVGSAAPPGGLALGAVCAGVLVQYAPAPTHLVYWLLVGASAVGLVVLFAVPETVRPGASWERALRPRIGVPRQARSALAAVTPNLVANWALSGLFLSLGGSLTAAVLHSPNHALAGLDIFALAGTGVLASVVTAHAAPRMLILGGSTALVVGVAIGLIGLHRSSAATFFAGCVVAGLGYGPTWTGTLQTVLGAASAEQRATLVAAVYLVSYLAFSLPAIGAGIATTHVGLLQTTTWYGIAVIVLVVVAAVAAGLRSDRPAQLPPPSCPACPGTVAPHPSVAATTSFSARQAAPRATVR